MGADVNMRMLQFAIIKALMWQSMDYSATPDTQDMSH
jgi:hypothetical protein